MKFLANVFKFRWVLHDVEGECGMDGTTSSAEHIGAGMIF